MTAESQVSPAPNADAARVELLLSSVAAGSSTDIVSQATNELATVWFKRPDAIPFFIHILSSSQSPPVRQLAAVEARKLVQHSRGRAWLALPVHLRDTVKSSVLTLAVAEPANIVRHSIARVISEIAKIELANNSWADLIPALNSLCSSHIPGQREIGIYIFFTLFEVIADKLSDHLPQLLSLFCHSVADPDSLSVAVTTVQALGKIADFVDDDQSQAFHTLRDLVPAMVQTLQRSLAAGDSESAIKIFEVFENFLLLEIPILSKHYADIISLYLAIAQNNDNPDDVRVMALSFVMQCIIYSRSKIQKLGIAPRIISAVMPIATSEEPEDRDQQFPAKLALQVIHTLSTSFAPHLVYPAVMQHVVSYAQNPDPGHRRAALLAVAVLVEGCADHMRDRFSEFMPLIVRALQDPHPAVRRAGSTAVGSLSEDLGEEIAEQHAVLLPLLLNLTDDTDPEIQPVVLSTIDSFVDSLEDGLQPYLDALMNKLVVYIGSSNRKTALTATTCIGSAARAVEAGFAPYFEVTMTRLHALMSLTDVADLDLRAVATDAVGALAEAMGKAAFLPYMNGVMELAIAGIHIDNSALREHSYVLFGVLARVFKEEFSPYLSLIVPQILHSCNLEDKDWNSLLDDIEKQKNKSQSLNAAESNDIDLDDDDDNIDDDDDDDEDVSKLNINSAISQEKQSSLDALCDLFAATRTAFLPYATDCVNAAVASLDNFNDDIRGAASQCLLRFFQTVYSMSSPPEWEFGLPLKVPVHENVAAMGKIAIEGVLTLLEDETSRMVTIRTLQQLTETIKEVGPASLSQEYTDSEHEVKRHLDVLGNMLLQIFRAEHPCQVSDFDNGSGDDGQDDEELAELDALLIGYAGDTVVAIVAALGEQAVPYFEAFMPLISKHYRKSRPMSDRNMAIGVLAEASEGLEAGVTKFSSDLLDMFMKGLRDEEDEVRSNAAFGIGVVVQNSTQDLSPFYPQLLQLLHPLFVANTSAASTAGAEGDDGAASAPVSNMVDNACGAVSRMTLRNMAAMPLDHVLPVIISALPLKRDLQENESVYKCLLMLVEAQHPAIAPHFHRVRELCREVVALPQHGQLTEATCARIERLLAA